MKLRLTPALRVAVRDKQRQPPRGSRPRLPIACDPRGVLRPSVSAAVVTCSKRFGLGIGRSLAWSSTQCVRLLLGGPMKTEAG